VEAGGSPASFDLDWVRANWPLEGNDYSSETGESTAMASLLTFSLISTLELI